MPKTVNDVHIALDRLGLGARKADRRRIAGDPRGAVLAELEARDAFVLADRRLASTSAVYRAMTIFEATRKQDRGGKLPTGQSKLIEEGQAGDSGCGKRRDSAAAVPPPPEGVDAADFEEICESYRLRTVAADGKKQAGRVAYVWEIDARLNKARDCDIGFTERLVAFWANHFAVNGGKGYFIEGLTGAFEREAIRPHVLGRFEDMALAASQHPAMQWSLDNRTSVGPNSSTGKRLNVGLNENHARELLELHTLGVDGGYTQQDVTSLAKILTGWGVQDNPEKPDFGEFAFASGRHEPGPQTVLGRDYAEAGEDQGVDAIRDLARHPATASHIARRLVAAFVADDPPKPLVEKLARTFRDTQGDLGAVTRALVKADLTWDASQRRYRSPQDFVFAIERLLGRKQKVGVLMSGLDTLGQAFWRPPSPEGYSLRGADWLSPGALGARLSLAGALARENQDDVDPTDLAREVYADALTDETLSAVARAASREQGLTLLMMSPEMQWR